MTSALAAAMTLQLSLFQIPCNASPGTIITPVYFTGGNGNTITFSLSGDTTDFGWDGKNIIVKNNITSIHCGTAQSITLTATQR